MDEKRALIAVAISFVILVGWGVLFPPSKPEPQPAAPTQSEAQPLVDNSTPSTQPRQQPTDVTTPSSVDNGEAVQEPSYTPAEAATSASEYTLQNEHFIATFSNQGGRLTSFKLVDYTTDLEPLQLLPTFENASQQYLAVDLDDRGLADAINDALFVTEQSGNRLQFRWSDGRGVDVTKTITIEPDSWMWHADLEVIDRGRPLPARLVMGPGFGAQEERGSRTYYYEDQLIWYTANGVQRSAAQCGFLFITTACRDWKAATKKNKTAPAGGVGGSVRWAGLEDQFFTALAIADESGADLRWDTREYTHPPKEGEEESETKPHPLLSVSVPDGGAQFYFGPKAYKDLKEYGLNLEETVWFSSKAWLAAIVRMLYRGLQWLHSNTIANWGVAIILATFFLRLILFPLNQFAMLRMRKTQAEMARIQPKLKAIKARYAKKKDAASRQKMNEETMALYREEGINPMGGVSGCLPMFLQFPILIGFYNMLTVAVELRGAPFYLWIKDLSQPDPYYLIPVAMGLTMFFQQRMSMSKVTDPVAQQQQKFMMFMPFMFTFFCLQMPAGMVLYWFVNNLLGIGQQWLVNRQAARATA